MRNCAVRVDSRRAASRTIFRPAGPHGRVPARSFRSSLSTLNRPRRSLMEMSVGVLDHYNVSTHKLNETVQFYENVLGLKNGPRPPFNFPGAWLYSEGRPVLHLNDISGTDKQQ